MSTVFRHALISDMKEILEIVNYEILNTTAIWDYDVRSLEEQIKIFEEKKEKNFPLIVAVKNNKVIGFGTYGPFRIKIGYRFTVEHSVYVHKDFHGLGIGSLLLQELIQIAKDQNLHTMIGVIDSENTGSITFHKKYGFEEVGRIKETGFKFNKWLDSVFLQLLLNK